jgi:hypothetical protein
MPNYLALFSLLRSISFGGAAGFALMGCLYLIFPDFFTNKASFETMLVFGAVLGGAIHRLIDVILIEFLLRPSIRIASYYKKVAELQLQKNTKLMTEESYENIKRRIDTEYFVGTSDELLDRKSKDR